MSRLSTRGRKRVKFSNFVFPRGTKAAPGDPKFPINDKPHARAALGRAGQKKVRLTKKERCTVVKKVCTKFPTMGLCQTKMVSAKSALKGAGCGLLAKAKAKPKKRAAAKGTITGKWRSDPRGGVIRTIRVGGKTTTQWSPFGKPVKTHSFFFKYPDDGKTVVGIYKDKAAATEAVRALYAKKGKQFRGTVRQATKAEERALAEDMAKWD